MSDAFKNWPRLYVDSDLASGQAVVFDADQSHYLHHVLRRNTGEKLRLFNGRDGEWLAAITLADKKAVKAECSEQLFLQSPPAPARILLFAPIKKQRLDFLIEKAVELGVTRLQPVLTRHTEVRTLNDDRICAQIIEAAEQCERLDIPVYSPSAALDRILAGWPAEIPVLACLERAAARPLTKPEGPCALLIGPEGGFAGEEVRWLLDLPFVRPVTLGPRILRSETAAMAALAMLI